MRFLIIVLSILVVAVTAFWTGGREYDGLLPAVDVTAPRYEHQDDAWSGLMPGVEVTAARLGTGSLARTTERVTQTSPLIDPFGTPMP